MTDNTQEIYGVITQRLNNLTTEDYSTLKQLCQIARNLYNQAIYNIKQHYIQKKEYLRYESNYHLIKNNENYKLLNVQIAQQTLIRAHRDFENFLKKLKRKKKKDLLKSKIEDKLIKNELYPLHITKFSIKDNTFTIPLSREGKNHFSKVKIKVSKIVKDLDIKEIAIIPIANGKWFEAHYIYKIEQIKVVDNESRKALGIKLGLDNLTTCVDTEGNSFTIDGKRFVSVIQKYTNEYRRLKAVYIKQGLTMNTNKIITLREKRKTLVRDYLHKTAKIIIDYCIENNISYVVIGTMNKNFLLKTYYDKENNQNIALFIPFNYLKKLIKHKCQKYGINFIEVNEDNFIYQASALDKDPLPNSDKDIEIQFSGKQLENGFYLTKNGEIINTDINTCLNILRRAGFELNFDYAVISEKLRFPKKFQVWK